MKQQVERPISGDGHHLIIEVFVACRVRQSLLALASPKSGDVGHLSAISVAGHCRSFQQRRSIFAMQDPLRNGLAMMLARFARFKIRTGYCSLNYSRRVVKDSTPDPSMSGVEKEKFVSNRLG